MAIEQAKKTPRVNEFIHFIELLLSNAAHYQLWLIRLNPGSKDPISGVSWKNPSARLTIDQAIAYMQHGGNIGIAGTTNDNLVNMDCDGGIIQPQEVKPTLMVRTRSREGLHAFYWNIDTPKIPNIPTDEAGEVRSQWQYVVAAGSYVKTDPATVPEQEQKNAGYYTVENAQPPTTITFEELPQIFKDTHNKTTQTPKPTPPIFNPKKATGKNSALFDITAYDVCLHEGGKTTEGVRWPSIFHDSETGANMSYSRNGILHCWRHNCSFNGLQALTVLSGYMTCKDAGSPHRGSGAGTSGVIGDNGAIFHAWLYAKQHGYIPKDDPIPTKAMHYIAEKHLGHRAQKDQRLPWQVYNQVLQIVEAKY
ncbi:MAG: hypothetical protein LBH79_03110 [Nitrososphaerota archaeon]|jgi:putative DNA primase/helicase|nr:hypothetical protein [Nitrososphaerota archaeon]